MRRMIAIMLVFLLLSCFSQEQKFADLERPYPGQKPPGAKPEIFAPGVINFGLFTRDVAMTRDGKEFYFRVSLRNGCTVILETHTIKGNWTEPEITPFSSDPRWRSSEPCISPDGKQFFFTSNRPQDPDSQEPGPCGIWVMDRIKGGWGEPRRLSDSINGLDGTYFPSVTQDGTLYFCRGGYDGSGAIWRAHRGINDYLAPEKLPSQVNAGTRRYNAFVAPDESYVILSLFGREDSQGGWDYYIVYRHPDDTWCEPVNLGPSINSTANLETSAFLSRDGKYLFFSSDRVNNDLFRPKEKLTVNKLKALAGRPGTNGDVAIYWVDAKIIKVLQGKN